MLVEVQCPAFSICLRKAYAEILKKKREVISTAEMQGRMMQVSQSTMLKQHMRHMNMHQKFRMYGEGTIFKRA